MPVLPRFAWRSVWLPRAITAVALVIGLPLFLRSPPWCDITLYQMAARNILHGGVHYKDLFDTNLPGFVWAMTALYWLFGPSALAVRVVDLLVVLGIVLLIDRVAKWAGATPAVRWWAFAGAALFYPFTVEMSHAQRDTWMALPGMVAVALRVRRGMRVTTPVESPLNSSSDGRGEEERPAFSPLRASFLEGMLWGVGVWMKPHIALMALVVWLLTVRRLASESARPRRAMALDFVGNILGGLAVGILGVIWMVASGAWGPFLNVFLEWNPLYMELARREFDWRVAQQLFWFPPWSLGLIATVPLALASVLDAPLWSRRSTDGPGLVGRWLPWWLWDRDASANARFARGVLGGLYLTWALQAFFIQRGFQYAHVPETLLMIGVWASHRWVWVPLVLLWLAISSGLWIVADYTPSFDNQLQQLDPESRHNHLPRHAITHGSRLRAWPQCWRLNMPDAERYQLWDNLRLHPPHEASISWVEIAEVAEFLRAQGVQDGEVVAWFDSPHAVYLLLDRDPGIRFMHVYTAISIFAVKQDTDQTGDEMMLEELKKTPQAKYVISDLEWVALWAHNDPQKRAELLGPARNPPHELLPIPTPFVEKLEFNRRFPFNQPTIFRSRNGIGRYIIHRIETRADGIATSFFKRIADAIRDR